VSMNDLITGVVCSAPQKAFAWPTCAGPFVVEACGGLYGNIVTGPNGLNVAEPV
jgi:hypothetical protein